ncbi:MAG TPA: sulfite exporter TauE/SafE family protein [Methylorubrum populi]|uniref:Probable membrane transporter protein n=1 Tax=Methylorubrum populi TaxID=223967 RepID=A0A921JFL2_9HYPH|nr:sulfite exporter TauE/SafE family protein [Methylorubrum populi]
MGISTYVIVGFGAALAGFVQGLSGFAFGLVAISVWAWVIDPASAAALAVTGSLTGQIIAALSVRRGFDLAHVAPFILGGLAGIPLGAALVPHLDMSWFKTILGALLVLWCPAMLLSKDLPRVTLGGRVADAAVGFGGGVLGGLGGFTGTLPTLWCTLRGYERDVQRAVIQNFNLSMLAVTFIVYLSSGLVTARMLPMIAVVLPSMLVPTLFGTRIYVGLSETGFRRLVLGLLTVSGIALLVSGLPGLLR